MRKLAALLLVSVLGCLSMSAQEVSAGITGRVTDPSGSAIVGAKVVATDTDRGTDFPTVTNEEGIYAFPRIPLGKYQLKVEATGFKTNVVSAFTLEVNQRARVDIRMELGGVAETVTVSAEAAMLQTETTQVGTVIDSQTIVNTPLISRNPIALTLLAPGVTTPNPAGFNSGQRTTGGGRPYVNGNREEGNNFLLDGVDNNQTSDNLTSYQPNLDAIAEFKMITNNASAEFGNFQGGIINVVIKSGTNQFHGNVFEYFRNDKLNANNWGRNWNVGQNFRPPIRWNQFGGTFGGPIFKDKLFFFADYQGLRRATPPSIAGARVMPEAWRRGDLSRLLDPVYSGVAGGIQLYNPFSVNASGIRAPFPNNQIPTSLFNPVITKLFADPSLYPLPSLSTQVVANDNNFFYSASSYLKSDQGDLKLDYKPTDKDSLTARYSNGRQDTPGVNTAPYLYNSFNIAPFQNGVINWTRTINPRVVNEARVGVNNLMLNNGGQDKGLGDIASKLGIQNVGPGLLSLQGFAFTTGLGSANIGTQQLFATTTYHYADNLTLIHGRHMMKMGGNILRQHMNVFYAGNNGRTGYMSFGGRFTAQNAVNPTGRFVGEADFLLGLPDNLGRGLSTGTWGHRKTIYGFYFQDDWRITDRLTLNLGLRWEYHTPLVEVKDRQSNFGLFTGELMLAGQNGNSRALYFPFKKDFQPRVGFAFTATKSMVIRGAYTISSFMEGTGTNLRMPLNPPFNSEFQTLYNTPSDILPATRLDQGLAGLSALDPYRGANIRLWDPHVRPANVQQWNFTMEFQLPAQNLFTVGYVGQHGTHLVVAMPYFQRQLVNGQILPSPYMSGNPSLTSRITQISGTDSGANQKYNSLQATLKKRFSMGLQYSLAYTWQKGMSDSIGYYGEGGQAGGQSAYMQNLYDRKAEWGPTYFDVTHNFVGSFVYEMPFGRKKKFGANWHPALDGVVGGWQLGGIYTTHGGFPLTIKDSQDRSGTVARSFRVNVNGKANDPHKIGPGELFLDPTPYSVPAARTFGNIGIGTVRGPGMSRFDLSVGKKFALSESRWFEVRAEAFNLTNTPIFLSPASQTITSTLFGQIRGSQGERNIELAAKFYF